MVGIVLFGQLLEGNVLSPKLVGESAGLHPVWLIFALLTFGFLFGFVGLLLAVPVAAAAGVLTRFAVAWHRTVRSIPETRRPRRHDFSSAAACPGARSRRELCREDFFSGPCNETVLRLIDCWPDWPANAIALVGPEGSGKTIWR